MFDELGQKLSKKLRFKKFRIRIAKRRFKLEGEVNPRVLLVKGQIKHVDEKDCKRQKALWKTLKELEILLLKGLERT